jgi:V-type H+-transporting ATPase subunit C
LLTKTLDGIIKKQHIVESEYLTTLFVVVPKNQYKEWLKSYDSLDDIQFVVPESSEKIDEDNNYGLFNVVLVKKIAQDFKNACTKRKFGIND